MPTPIRTHTQTQSSSLFGWVTLTSDQILFSLICTYSNNNKHKFVCSYHWMPQIHVLDLLSGSNYIVEVWNLIPSPDDRSLIVLSPRDCGFSLIPNTQVHRKPRKSFGTSLITEDDEYIWWKYISSMTLASEWNIFHPLLTHTHTQNELHDIFPM